MLGYMADNILTGLTTSVQWSELADRVDLGATVVDVRSASEFKSEHIPGAVNVPVDELRERFGELPKNGVIVYCKVGQRGHTAATLLGELGIQASNLDGGYQTWSHSPAARS